MEWKLMLKKTSVVVMNGVVGVVELWRWVVCLWKGRHVLNTYLAGWQMMKEMKMAWMRGWEWRSCFLAGWGDNEGECWNLGKDGGARRLCVLGIGLWLRGLDLECGSG